MKKLTLATILIVGGAVMSFTDFNPEEKDKEAILAVIRGETMSFYHKDFNAFENSWAHGDYVRIMGWWKDGGVTVRKGWDEIGGRMKKKMADDPDPIAQVPRIDNVNMRISGNMAWVTFDQYGEDTGSQAFDMPGLSRETRILEKQNGQWKIVYVGWLLQGK